MSMNGITGGMISDLEASQIRNALALEKALDATHTQGIGTTGFAALKLEDMSKTLVSLTAQMSDYRAFSLIPKGKADNTVVEYAINSSFGSANGLFLTEMETPGYEDATYSRQLQKVKYMARSRAVSLAAQNVNTIAGSAMATAVSANILELIKGVNKAIFWGDENIIPVEFNGLYAQHRNNPEFGLNYINYMNSEVVIDLRGHRLNEDWIEQGTEVARRRYGNVNTILASTTVISGVAKNFHDAKFIQNFAGNAGFNGEYRSRVRTIESQFATVNLEADVFGLKNPARKTTDPAPSGNVPNAPIPDGTNPAVLVTDTSTKFADTAGTYFYGVAAINAKGESSVVQLGAAVVNVGATQSVDLKFTSGGGSYAPTGYVIYRSEVNPATAIGATPLYPIFRISTAELAAGFDGGAAGVVRDRNRFLANTEEAFMYENTKDFYEMRELLPMVKRDLPFNGQTDSFTNLYYATPVVYKPGQAIRFINVGKLA